MATDRADISLTIANRLLTVTSLDRRVYEYNPSSIPGIPYACVIGAGHDEVIADNARDLRLYNFDIIIYVERGKEGFGTQKAERIRRELEDDILAVFDNYQDMGGSVLWQRIRHGGWGYSGDLGLSYFTLNLTAYKMINIS